MPTRTPAELLATAVAAAGPTGSLPEALCVGCATTLPMSGVGLALVSERGHEGLVAASDAWTTSLEELQFSLGEGPSVDASASGRPVLHPDLARTGLQRWPGFGRAALEAGIAAIFAFPLQVGRIRIGALDLYRDSPGDLSPDQVAESCCYADAATTMLLEQTRLPPDGEPLQHLAEVHQATGMVAVQASVSLTEALLLLRAHAFASDRTLFDVACDVVHRRLRLGPDAGAS